MKIKFLKLENWLLMSLMGLLGLTSCHSSKQLAEPVEEPEPATKPREEIRLMYGTPTMDFRVSGHVKDANGKPIKGIAVNMLERGIEATADTIYGDQENIRKYLERSSVKTDAMGRFTLQSSGLPQENLRVLVRDVDGDENGAFSNNLIDVKITDDIIDRSKAGGWYQGSANARLEVKLEKK